MSSAQLAASAAFRANNQKTQPPLTNVSKPEVRKPTPSNSPKQRQKDVSPEKASPKPVKKPAEPANLSKSPVTVSNQASQPKQPSKKPDLSLDLSFSKSNVPSSLATAAAEHSARNQKPSVNSGSVYNTPLVKSPAAAAAAISSSEKLSHTQVSRPSIDDDNVSVISAHQDYFSMPKLYQSENHSGASRSRLSVVTDPKNMLDNVKQSINSKAKTGTSKESARRNQAALNEFRQSVALKRHSSHVSQDANGNTVFLLDSTENSTPSLGQASGSEESSPSFEHKIFHMSDLKGLNTSRLSVDSFATGSENETPVTPTIAVVDTDAEEETNDGAGGDGAKDENGEETFKKPPPINHSQPIAIPPSQNAVDRGNASNGGSGPDVAASISPTAPSSMAGLKLEDAVKKVRRRPPPEMIESEGSSGRHSFDLSHSNSSGIEDDDEENFPQFPGISDTRKHRGIFRRRKEDVAQTVRERQSMDSSNEVEIEEEPEETKPTSGISPVVANPHVALKTTMRKMKKKNKDFDENKPWKNHSKLDEVTDSERKRYEGVWVSNKGYLVNKVVTRLAGVDYSKNYTEEEQERKKALLKQDPSELAAKLSSALEPHTHENMDDHIKERHGLISADPNELIHGVVVKRIWKRSRLPSDTLAAIWDLVDFRKDGTLNKIEFLVGMWLVDQCLYGRKLPKKVEEQVWSSLGNIGLNVVIRKKRR